MRKKTAFLGRGFCADSSGLLNPCLLLTDETDDTQVVGVGEVMELANGACEPRRLRGKYPHEI